MAANSVTQGAKGKGTRRATGFRRAGTLIEAQLRTAGARRGFAVARLQALWGEIAGAEIAAVCTPIRLALARGPAGGLLTVGVEGAQAPLAQMLVPQILERVNAALGPGAIGRVQLTQGGRPESMAPPPAPRRPRAATAAGPLASELSAEISSIGDDALRAALETFARNVLSREQADQTPEG